MCAIGALIMRGYRMVAGRRDAYLPAILVVVSIGLLAITLHLVPINIRIVSSPAEVAAVIVASLAVFGLTVAIVLSLLRAHHTSAIPTGVLIETAKTASLVFTILIAAAMLTSAFGGLGASV